MIYDEPVSNVLMLHDFFTPEECNAELVYATKAGFVEQSYGVVNQESRRRAASDDAARAALIWDKIHFFPALESFYTENGGLKKQRTLRPDPFENFEKLAEGNKFWSAIGLNERLRYYQYEPGQRFAPHFDIMFRINDDTRTFLTFIVYLNDDFEGGETRFADRGVVKPIMGSVIIFPHELRHEGMVVTKGCKTIFRSDIVYRLEDM